MSNDEWFVTMPKLGETVTEGELTNWLKQVGDTIEFDDPLFEVSTDKVDSEIPSPYDGVIAEILVAGRGNRAGRHPAGADRRPAAGAGRARRTGCRRRPTTLAAAGGPALGDPAAPQMGGSEGPADEDPALGAPAGIVHDITMPKLGETVTEGTIGSWLKKAGDTIELDDPLFEVSTDKVDSEIPSPYDGVLLEILVAAGETVPVGTPLARIGEAGAAAPAASAATAPAPAGAGRGPGGRAPAATGGAAPAGGRGGRAALAAGPPAGRRERSGRRRRSPAPGSAAGSAGRTSRRRCAGGGADGRRPPHRAAPAAPRRPPAGGRAGRRADAAAPGRRQRPARRGRHAVPDAAGGGRRHDGLAGQLGLGVDLHRGRLRQRRQGAAASTRTSSRRRPARRCRTCRSSPGRRSMRCGRSRRSTPRSTSRPRP